MEVTAKQIEYCLSRLERPPRDLYETRAVSLPIETVSMSPNDVSEKAEVSFIRFKAVVRGEGRRSWLEWALDINN